MKAASTSLEWNTRMRIDRAHQCLVSRGGKAATNEQRE